MFSSAAFVCECGHTDIPEHPGDAACRTCECPKFRWSREDASMPAAKCDYPARAKELPEDRTA